MRGNEQEVKGGAHQKDRGSGMEAGGGKCRDGGENPEQYCVAETKREVVFRLETSQVSAAERRRWRSPAEGRCSGDGRSCGVLVQWGGRKSFANMALLFLII